MPKMNASNDKIMLVEDNDSLRQVLAEILEEHGYAVECCGSAEQALRALEQGMPSCILCDFKLPEQTGLDLLQAVRAIPAQVPFLLMTAYGSIDIAVQAMKLGANDFLTKPFEPEVLCRVLEQLFQHSRIIDRNPGSLSRRERRFLTENAATQQVLHRARKVAKVDTPVLILGESGTGKELVARMIHEQSPRRDQPFVALHCASLPFDLLESEIFGHEAGAYTGATQKRIGVFEYASAGTIFLDEIGDMPPPMQVKLLRALQENEIKRIGSNRTIKVNPRILSATNHDIEAALQRGTLREDFYYRLAVVTLTVPPLRARPEDITLLCEHYIDLFCSTTGRKSLGLSREALDTIRAYHWPGNTRELENVIERAVILAEDCIRPEHLGVNLSLDFGGLSEACATLHQVALQAAQQAEIEMIRRTLRHTLGNKAEAARLLGVSYKTLLSKVKEYGLSAAE